MKRVPYAGDKVCVIEDYGREGVLSLVHKELKKHGLEVVVFEDGSSDTMFKILPKANVPKVYFSKTYVKSNGTIKRIMFTALYRVNKGRAVGTFQCSISREDEDIYLCSKIKDGQFSVKFEDFTVVFKHKG